MDKLKLEDFTLEEVYFEVRYKKAPLIWDNVGHVWHEIQKRYPDINWHEVKPDVVIGTYDNRIVFNVSISRFNITVHNPKPDLEELKEAARIILPKLVEHLEITSYLRIGTRFLYTYRQDNLDRASKLVCTSPLLNPPHETHFDIKNATLEPGITMRLENEKRGIVGTLSTTKREINLDLTPRAVNHIPPYNEEWREITYDIDHYIISETPIGSFKADIWLTDINHLNHRDSKLFFG